MSHLPIAQPNHAEPPLNSDDQPGCALAATSTSAMQIQTQHQSTHQRQAYRYVKWQWRAAAKLLDVLGATVFRPAPQSSAVQVCKLLWLHSDQLGDAVLSLEALAALRALFPQAELHVLASSGTVAFFQSLPLVDRVVAMRASRVGHGSRGSWLLQSLRQGWQLRKERYDLVVDPRGEIQAALLSGLSQAPLRVGFASGGGGFWLTHRVPWLAERHEVASRRALVQAVQRACFGASSEAAQGDFNAAEHESATGEVRASNASAAMKTGALPLANRGPRYAVPEWARQQILERLAGKAAHQPTHAEPGNPLVVLHLGAGTSAKRWPLAAWRELMGQLLVYTQATVALVGGPEDSDRVAELLEGREWPNVFNWVGQLAIVELAAALERASVVVGADSFPAHLAASVGTPVVALFSGTNSAAVWRPWGEQVRVIHHTVNCAPCHLQICPLAGHPCMTGISPDEVFAAVLEMAPLASVTFAKRHVSPLVCRAANDAGPRLNALKTV